jgi:hypothetical protein
VGPEAWPGWQCSSLPYGAHRFAAYRYLTKEEQS